MRVLVTGGAGYVGSHCVRLLCQRGHEVVVLDDLSAGHEQAVDRGARLVVGDVGDERLLGQLLGSERFDGLMHFAASIDVAESVRDPLKYYRNNVVKTVQLLEAVRRAGLRRMVFSSSCAVYGVPSRVPIDEDAPEQPITPYGRTKLLIEWALRDSAAAWGLGSVSLRYFNAAGCSVDGTIGEDHQPETHLIPRVLQAVTGRSAAVAIYGTDYPTADGTCIRDYVQVEDLAAAHLLALEAVQPGQARYYNVGSGRGYSVREVIEAISRVTGQAIRIEQADRRQGDPPILLAETSRIRRELGWQPRFTEIELIVQTAWRWHRSHPQGYGDRRAQPSQSR